MATDRRSFDFLSSISFGGDDRAPAKTVMPSATSKSAKTTPKKKEKPETPIATASAPMAISATRPIPKKKPRRSASTSSEELSKSSESSSLSHSDPIIAESSHPDNQNQRKKTRARRHSHDSETEGDVELLLPKATTVVARQSLEETVSTSDSDMELTDIRVTSVSVPKPQLATVADPASVDKKTKAPEGSRKRGKSFTEKEKDISHASVESIDDKAAAVSFLSGIELGVSPQLTKKKEKDKTEKDDSSKMLSSSMPDKGGFSLKKATSTAMQKQQDKQGTFIPVPTPKKSTDQTKPRKLEAEPPRIIEGSKFKLKGAAVLDTRLAYKTKTGFPFLISSLLPVDKLKRKAASQRKTTDKPNSYDIHQLTDAQPVTRSSFKKGQGVSYGELLEVLREPYDPNFLDLDIDIPDKYKITINLPGYRSTLIPYVKAPDLKKTENEIFQEKHPWLKSNITLSKIRSVKRNIIQISIARALDIACVAFSFVYFERLVMKNVITKSNAKLMGGICLLLAEKFYGTKSKSFKHLVETIEKQMGVTRKDISQNEFFVYKELAFSLYAEPTEVVPHLIKLQSTQEYLDHLFEYNAEQRKQIAMAQKEALKRRKEASRGSQPAPHR